MQIRDRQPIKEIIMGGIDPVRDAAIIRSIPRTGSIANLSEVQRGVAARRAALSAIENREAADFVFGPKEETSSSDDYGK